MDSNKYRIKWIHYGEHCTINCITCRESKWQMILKVVLLWISPFDWGVKVENI